MEFQKIPVTCQPAYTWLWNTTITKEEIKRQIEEMHENGIRAFYVLGEPENFRPAIRRTHLDPPYLSDEYIELVHYAFCVAQEKGMHTWLYNEGGFPSGMVCGRIRKEHPELAQKTLEAEERMLAAGTVYESAGALAAFAGTEQIQPGTVVDTDTSITEIFAVDAVKWCDIQSDNAKAENTKCFLELTHEALKKRFGEHMGREVTMMFDDESGMGTWTDGLDQMFLEKYGYELYDYLPYLCGIREPQTKAEYRACSDYRMLCGELLCQNYFRPMREWLNANRMQSVGHLDRDNGTDGPIVKRYGNMMHMLREFDVPGVDVIWSQITYPENGRCCSEGNSFFPRLASSAARQQGSSLCLSESFAVYGAHVTPEEMRFAVNYQAVRGISLFNFMVISFDRDTVMCHQYRPNFIGENVGMDCLGQINDYTARLSYLLQESKAEVHTALYWPLRTLNADGAMGRKVIEEFDALGQQLEDEGIVFDIIDEELVENGSVENGVLHCGPVSYENVFVPEYLYQQEHHLEKPEVLAKLQRTGKTKCPCIGRKNPALAARKLLFADGSEGYFLCSAAGETITEEITIKTDRHPLVVNLYDGSLQVPKYSREGAQIKMTVKLLRGEGMMLWLTEAPQEAEEETEWIPEADLTELTSYVSRRFTLDPDKGSTNQYFTAEEEKAGFHEWPADFSGEVTYRAVLPEVPEEAVLDLGEVRHFAKVYLNNKKLGEVTMPPYRIPLTGGKAGDELKVVVANTIANVCHNAEYFNRQHPADVGPYHENMVKYEAKAPAGGLLGPVQILQKKV